jgi:hypothetical protein
MMTWETRTMALQTAKGTLTAQARHNAPSFFRVVRSSSSAHSSGSSGSSCTSAAASATFALTGSLCDVSVGDGEWF